VLASPGIDALARRRLAETHRVAVLEGAVAGYQRSREGDAVTGVAVTLAAGGTATVACDLALAFPARTVSSPVFCGVLQRS
jgi:hypothetical protein